MAILARNILQPGRFNNYLLAGNLTNAFVMGSMGATDDFFLLGSEPPDESSYPVLTGNFLDSEGQPLFRLVRNVLTINPGNCSKIVGDHIGYEIHDSAGKLIFRVETRFTRPEGMSEDSFVTTLSGTFFDKTGAIAFQAHSGADEHLEANDKVALGFSGGFGFVQNMSETEVEVARIALATHGTIHELITGSIDGEELELDGKAVIGAVVTNCTIKVSSGRWILRDSTIRDCRFMFAGEAANVRTLVKELD